MMDKKIRLGGSYHIIGITTLHNETLIRGIFLPEVREVFDKYDLHFPDNWKIDILPSYFVGEEYEYYVSKNKYGNIRSYEIKEVSILIPIPTQDKISWGIIVQEDYPHSPPNESSFRQLEITWADYDNMDDFVLACLRKGMKKALEEGITVGGQKIQIKKIEYPNWD